MRPAGAMMRPRRHDRGFTLVEVLVATFITTTGLILSRLKHGFESRWGHQLDRQSEIETEEEALPLPILPSRRLSQQSQDAET